MHFPQAHVVSNLSLPPWFVVISMFLNIYLFYYATSVKGLFYMKVTEEKQIQEKVPALSLFA